MSSRIKLIPLGAVLALAVVGASAQTTTTPSATTPPVTSTPPATLGVTPQEAGQANRNAVPRSDTGTVVRTAPSPADRARTAMDGNSNTTPMAGTSGDRPMRTMRRARADRN